MMPLGPDCISRQQCAQYNSLARQFEALGAWFGPNDAGDGDISAASLRAWWTAHGCVRCFLKAYNKYYNSNDWDVACDPVGDRYRLSNPDVLPQLAKAIKDWRNPGSRRSDRFYCHDCTESLGAGVALFQIITNRVVAAVGAGANNGHTAWAYRIPAVWQDELLPNTPPDDSHAAATGEWRVGQKLVLGGGNDMTCAEDASAYFEDCEFTAYKPLTAPDGNFEEAFLTALEVLQEPYLLALNNCNQAAHAVLTALGARGIPGGKGFWNNSYTPGDYFDAVNAPATYFKPYVADPEPLPLPKPLPPPPAGRKQPPAPRPVPAPAPPRAKARQQMRAASIGTDVIYRLGEGPTLHLTLACTALGSATSEPDEYGVEYTEDLAAVAADFGGTVCGTCLRILKGGPKLVCELPAGDGLVQFCHDRLIYSVDDGGTEVLFERITGRAAKWLTLGHVLTIAYRVPLEDGEANEVLEIGFADTAERDACLAELNTAMQGWD